MECTMKTKYNIGQVVYFNLPDSEQHLITDINFLLKNNTFIYEIMCNAGGKQWYSEGELTKEKIPQL